MRRWGAVFVGCLALAAVALAQPLFSPTQDPLAGSRVFGAKGCVKCHTINGIGGQGGPDLGRRPRPRSFYELATAMWNHAPRMAERIAQLGVAEPRLNTWEAGDLVAFLFTLDYFDSPGKPDVGRRLFAEKRCIVCHQVGGTGGVVGPSLDFLKQYGTPIFLATAMWNHGPEMLEAMKARGIQRPTFKDDELRDLIAYINSASPILPQGPLYLLPGRSAEGRLLFAQRRCGDCHSVGGPGGMVGPELGERALHRTPTQFVAAMWNKAPAMLEAMKNRAVRVPLLRPEEMADIVAYLYSVRYFESGDPRKGAQVVAAKGCLGCHALHGERRKVASDLARAEGLDAPAAVLAVLWNHVFVQSPSARAASAWPELSAAEMADLVAYLQSLRRPR